VVLIYCSYRIPNIVSYSKLKVGSFGPYDEPLEENLSWLYR
jgi:hypothetical protein